VLTGSTFGGNWADHEGGALHLLGSEIADFSGNTFVGNEVSPGASRPVNQSEGAALYIGVATSQSLDALGAVTDSVFTDNIGLPIFEADVTATHECGCANRVTYEDNRFYNTTYGDDVFKNSIVAGAHTADELNALVVDRGSGDTTDKSIDEGNLDESQPVSVAEVLIAPMAQLTDRATGSTPRPTESILGWVWNGGCAELDGTELDPVSEAQGSLSAAMSAHLLAVWDGGSCVGSEALSAAGSVFDGPDPAGDLTASPSIISGGGSSTLSWTLSSGALLTGLISQGAAPEVTNGSGSTTVTPDNTNHFDMGLVTKQGGLVRGATVWVDENPQAIFADGFESGDASAWTGSSP